MNTHTHTHLVLLFSVGSSVGTLTLTLDHVAYAVNLSLEDQDGPERLQVCFWTGGGSICADVISSVGEHERKRFQVQLVHTFSWLLSAGTWFNCSVSSSTGLGEAHATAKYRRERYRNS